MTDKLAFMYIDDVMQNVTDFENTVRSSWAINYDVLSNKTFGLISHTKYDEFENEIIDIITENVSRIACIFLDMDFSGEDDQIKTEGIDLTGIMIGKEIRRRWLHIPIIISSRYTKKEIYDKGMLFDIDFIVDSTKLIQMTHEQFQGMIKLAKDKRHNILECIGDIPIGFRTGTHKYFRNVPTANRKNKYIFIAMPFDTEVVGNDVWELGINEACFKCGYDAVRVDASKMSVSIMNEIASYIYNSSIVIADITQTNPNVMYELGLTHSANLACIIISQGKAEKNLPFDVRHIRVIEYCQTDIIGLKNQLCEAICQVGKLN